MSMSLRQIAVVFAVKGEVKEKYLQRRSWQARGWLKLDWCLEHVQVLKATGCEQQQFKKKKKMPSGIKYFLAIRLIKN